MSSSCNRRSSPPVTEIIHGGSILRTYPLIHNEATQETKIAIDQDSHNATPAAAEFPQVNSSILSTFPSNTYTRIRPKQNRSVAKEIIVSDNPVNQESIFNPTEPGTYHEAINCLETDFWIKGIKEEYTTLENNTWILCQLPSDQKAIVGKWVLKYKPVLRQLPHDTRPGS